MLDAYLAIEGEVSSRDERMYQFTWELERKFHPGKP
jgi:hypothetical protein